MTLLLRPTPEHMRTSADDYRVFWNDIMLGSIMRGIGVPATADQWRWGFCLPGMSQDRGALGTGKDRDDCMAQFKVAWQTVEKTLTAEDIATAKRRCAEMDEQLEKWK